jgi:glycosyltransferase involved in cell wall biosynthesis
MKQISERHSLVAEVWIAIPGDIETLTGGYIYARRLIDSLRGIGWHPHLIQLPSSFPAPTTADLERTCEIFRNLPEGAVVLVDGLAFGAIPLDLLDNLNLNFVALVHHPLAMETGISLTEAAQLHTSEKYALTKARAIITTGPDTAQTLIDRYEVPAERIFIATPGTDSAARARGSGAEPQLLTVATLTHRKGYDVLVRALATSADLRWTSACIGSLSREPGVSKSISDMIRTHKLSERIKLHGEVAGGKLIEIYAQSDIFVLPSRHEGYGMAFAEAQACGLPVIACAVGAVPDTVPKAAGLLVPPNNPEALSKALRRLLTDTTARATMSEASWTNGQKLPRWEDTAKIVATALEASL